jgi:hypothetical protein
MAPERRAARKMYVGASGGISAEGGVYLRSSEVEERGTAIAYASHEPPRSRDSGFVLARRLNARRQISSQSAEKVIPAAAAD